MRKLLVVGLAIFLSLLIGLVGAGTWAFLSDTEASSGNSFSAGTLDLKIRDQDEPFGDGVTGTWTASNMAPGASWSFTVPFVELDALGSIKPDHVRITCDYSVSEEVPQTEADTDPDTNLDADKMAKVMVITWCTYTRGPQTTDCLTDSKHWRRIEDQDGDGRITFYDLKLDALKLLPPDGHIPKFQFGVKFHEDAGNDFQGDTFNLTMAFTLNQETSQ